MAGIAGTPELQEIAKWGRPKGRSLKRNIQPEDDSNPCQLAGEPGRLHDCHSRLGIKHCQDKGGNKKKPIPMTHRSAIPGRAFGTNTGHRNRPPSRVRVYLASAADSLQCRCSTAQADDRITGRVRTHGGMGLHARIVRTHAVHRPGSRISKPAVKIMNWEVGAERHHHTIYRTPSARG